MTTRFHRRKVFLGLVVTLPALAWLQRLSAFAAVNGSAVNRQEIWNSALPVMIPIFILSFLAIAAIVLIGFFPHALSAALSAVIKGLNIVLRFLSKFKFFRKIEKEVVEDVAKKAGYLYDPKQDIFYSELDPWQRKMGYCRLYDEGMAPMGMICDCDPVTFDYGGKRWLIEFWKGQYDLCTGFEVGVYNTADTDMDIPEFFTGTFYQCASNSELLYMSCVLKKNGRPIFGRAERHWWLTGFRVGEFSQPDELSVSISITLKDEWMRDAFVAALRKIGYHELLISKNTVSLTFDEPKTRQPFTRTRATDWIIQKKNEYMCEKYQELTKGLVGMDKLRALQRKDPGLYNKVSNIGKMHHFVDTYNVLKKYTNE